MCKYQYRTQRLSWSSSRKKLALSRFGFAQLCRRVTEEKFSFYRLKPDTLYINFGFWDVVPSHEGDGFYNQLVEDKVRELEGFKGLYSNVYYSEQEFWQIYDKDSYFALKSKYDPQNKLAQSLCQVCGEIIHLLACRAEALAKAGGEGGIRTHVGG